MEKLTEGTLLQVNATIIVGLFIFISLIQLNIFDLPFKFDDSKNLTNPDLLTQGNVVTIFFFITIMIYSFIISSILILVNKFDIAKLLSISGFIIIFFIMSIILYSSITSMAEKMS